MTEERIYDYQAKAHGSGFIVDGVKVERITETDVLHFMMKEVTACNVKKGWHDTERTFGDDIALLHS